MKSGLSISRNGLQWAFYQRACSIWRSFSRRAVPLLLQETDGRDHPPKVPSLRVTGLREPSWRSGRWFREKVASGGNRAPASATRVAYVSYQDYSVIQKKNSWNYSRRWKSALYLLVTGASLSPSQKVSASIIIVSSRKLAPNASCRSLCLDEARPESLSLRPIFICRSQRNTAAEAGKP